jgi:hypothetical protein
MQGALFYDFSLERQVPVNQVRRTDRFVDPPGWGRIWSRSTVTSGRQWNCGYGNAVVDAPLPYGCFGCRGGVKNVDFRSYILYIYNFQK